MRTLFFLFKALLIVLLYALNTACSKSADNTIQDKITKSFSIDILEDEVYYFPAKKFQTENILYQPLRQFDLIFTAYDTNSSKTSYNSHLISQAIPGDYTHMLMYIGKDSQGFAYGVEMNSDISKDIRLGKNGLELDGHLYVYCLGSDFGEKECPVDNYIYGIDRYDYLWAKRLEPKLLQELKKDKKMLIQRIKQDLISAYPFELQFEISKELIKTKKILIVDSINNRGRDCASYFISLFEELLHLCLEDIRMDAKELEDYYMNDRVGQKAYIPLEYNLLTSGGLYFKDLIELQKFSFENNTPRDSQCRSEEKLKGFVTPDLIFNSPSMKEIKGLKDLVR